MHCAHAAGEDESRQRPLKHTRLRKGMDPRTQVWKAPEGIRDSLWIRVPQEMLLAWLGGYVVLKHI
eukprot:1156843-Pelagomonas_calceolata.AAC.8